MWFYSLHVSLSYMGIHLNPRKQKYRQRVLPHISDLVGTFFRRSISPMCVRLEEQLWPFFQTCFASFWYFELWIFTLVVKRVIVLGEVQQCWQLNCPFSCHLSCSMSHESVFVQVHHPSDPHCFLLFPLLPWISYQTPNSMWIKLELEIFPYLVFRLQFGSRLWSRVRPWQS